MFLRIEEMCYIVNRTLSNLRKIRERYSNGGQKSENPQKPSQASDRKSLLASC